MTGKRLARVPEGRAGPRSACDAPRGQRPLRPLERLELLCEEGSLQVIRSAIASDRMGDGARLGDGVVGAAGRVDGRPLFCYAQDGGFAGGSVGAAHAETIARVLSLARRARVPVVGLVASAGARMQEGLAALDGYGRIFAETVALSGDVPQVSVITGTSAGGGCYAPALTDFTIMTRTASMFLTGPGVVREVTGEDTTAHELGGSPVHERNGVCQLVADSDADAIRCVRRLLAYLPQNASEPPPCTSPAEPERPDPSDCVPAEPRRVYDARLAAGGIVDAGSLLELSPRWAPNIVTALTRLDGRPVGLVANQPRHLTGVIDAEAAQKAARFVRACDAFGVPLVVLVDTPGFLPGSRQEAAGVIRQGAELVRAFAGATVPRFTVVVRKAFGGAYITMNSKELGADLALAWPRAQLGIMGAPQAVGIIHRRELAAAGDPTGARHKLASDYEARHLSADAAARAGHIDEVIAPAETRTRLLWALSTRAPRT